MRLVNCVFTIDRVGPNTSNNKLRVQTVDHKYDYKFANTAYVHFLNNITRARC